MKSPDTSILDELATKLPPAVKLVHSRVPRLLWQDFQEIAALHHRDANKETVIAIQDHVRRHRAELLAARRAAHQAQEAPEEA